MKQHLFTACQLLVLCMTPSNGAPADPSQRTTQGKHHTNDASAAYDAFLKRDLHKFKKTINKENAEAAVQTDAAFLKKISGAQTHALSTMLILHYTKESLQGHHQHETTRPFLLHLIRNIRPKAKTLQAGPRGQEIEDLSQLFTMAAASGDTKIIKELIKQYPELIEKNRRSALPGIHGAVEKGNFETVKLIVENGKNQLQTDTHKQNEKPIHLAARAGHKDIVAWMLKKDPELLEIKDEHGKTPLYLAAMEGHDQTVKLLLDKGANPNLHIGGHHLLNHTISAGNANIAKKLLNNQKIQQKAINQVSFHAAAATCDIELIHMLRNKIDKEAFIRQAHKKTGRQGHKMVPRETAAKACRDKEVIAQMQKLLDPNPPKK